MNKASNGDSPPFSTACFITGKEIGELSLAATQCNTVQVRGGNGEIVCPRSILIVCSNSGLDKLTHGRPFFVSWIKSL